MDFIPLPIFPEGSLRESVVTTVWIGVLVISLFNLRFGWTYSGLVIPGYLVPLLLTNPLSATITFIEGVLAYTIVKVVSDYMSVAGFWSNLFGRDRFFALFLASIGIRVAMDGWVLPGLAGWLQNSWGLSLDYKNTFHSFGMIIVALIANQFWKTGVRRGLIPFLSTLGLTFALTRYGLMVFTNFNIGNIAYMYSDAAASLLASPKAYIILVVTGFIASRMNLFYGWEFNGILIPALLALQWYEPMKIFSSLVEAGVVYWVSDFILKLPIFRNITMEGARKLLLFFNVAYLYRFALGYLVPLISPGVVVSDYYGFAYLLSSLIALKMHGKHIGVRLVRTTVQTSFVAAVIANLTGLALASTLGSVIWGLPSAPLAAAPPLTSPATNVVDCVNRHKVALFQKRIPESVVLPSPPELNLFKEALALIRQYSESRSPSVLDHACGYLNRLDYCVERVGDNYLLVRERSFARGWGLYVINLKNPNGLLLEVPAPLEEWAVMESALWLFERLDAGGLAIAGGARRANKDGSSDALANPNLPFHIFHRLFARRNAMQVRGLQIDSRNPLLPAFVSKTPTESDNLLWVKRQLPPLLSLGDLKNCVGSDLAIAWQPSSGPNLQQRATAFGFCELWLSRETRTRIKAGFLNKVDRSTQAFMTATNGSLRQWLLSQKDNIAPAGSQLYVPPRPEQLLFIDEEVLAPLLDILAKSYRPDGLAPPGQQLLKAIDHSASLIGFRVVHFRDVFTSDEYFVLTENPELGQRRYWGTYVFRLGLAHPYQIQVPRPLYDLNTLECGVHLFERLRARCFLITGAHHLANLDGSADIMRPQHLASVFNLASQVIMRESGQQPGMAIQCRGFAMDQGHPPPAEVLLAFPNGVTGQNALSPLGHALHQELLADRFSLLFVDGSPATAGYEIAQVPQAQYLNQTLRQEFVVLWLSPILREVFRAQRFVGTEEAAWRALEIPTLETDVNQWLLSQASRRSASDFPEDLRQILDYYTATLDIVALKQALNRWPEFQFSRLSDISTQQTYLAITMAPETRPVLLNLNPRRSEESIVPSESSVSDQDKIRQFMQRRQAWLRW